MPCPEPSTLTHWRLCGQVAPACEGDPAPDITVIVNLVPTAPGAEIIDPTTGAMIAAGQVFSDTIPAQIDDPLNPGTLIDNPDAGCWCTCPLPATVAVDPNNALQGAFAYSINVSSGGKVIYTNQVFVLDYDTALIAPTDTYTCGTCIPLVNLIPGPPTVPASTLFCSAVENCITPATLTGPIAGVLSFNDGRGTITPHNLISGDVGNALIAGVDGGLLFTPAVAAGQAGLEDQNGVILPGFDIGTSEWNVPIDQVSDLGGAAPVAPTQEPGMAFTAHDTTVINGTTYVETQHVWNPGLATYSRVLVPHRDSVIESDPADTAVATNPGDHAAVPLSATEGQVTAAWVTADASLVTAPATVNVVVAGVVVGTAVIPAGQTANTPVLAALVGAPIAYVAGATGSFSIVGDGTGTISDIVTTFDFQH